MAPGDSIHMEVFAKYLDFNSNNWSGAISALVGGILSGTTPGNTVIDGGGYAQNSTVNLPTKILNSPQPATRK